MSWQPSTSLNQLKRRAKILQEIRAFFAVRHCLEVETPLLGRHTVTDPHIASFQLGDRYLQTSPEYAMKRLLAAGCGAVFQICKAFRREEAGHQHNPEFTLLEWYRPGYNHLELIDEVDQLLQHLLHTPPATTVRYQDLFEKHFSINPHHADLPTLKKLTQHQVNLNQMDDLDKTTCLQLLMSHHIEPTLGLEQPLFIIDYPVAQAALAKIRNDDPPVAERFELYYRGVELANGFHELNDPEQQRQRFLQDQQQRRDNQQIVPSLSEDFLQSLKQLPDCAGVALGVDRLLMLACDCREIKEVLSFDWARA